MLSKIFEYPNELNKIFDKLNKYDLKPIIVGGYIRDFYLDKNSKDIDIEVYGLDSIAQLSFILKEFGDIYEVGKSFGVCKLSFEGLELDFSMPRIDNKVSSGHKGFEVQTQKDLDYKTAASRRDFTINSIGYDTQKKQILDPFNGLVDLKVKLLKIVNKDTFIEDPLRVFRAMGMIGRFELKVDDNTLKLCKFMIDKKMLNELSSERIYEELKKLFLKSKKPSIALNFFKDINGFSFFNELDIDDTLWNKSISSLDNFAYNTQLEKLTEYKTNIKLSLVLLCYYLDDAKTISFIKKITNNKNTYIYVLETRKNVNLLINKSDTYTLRKIATKVLFIDIFKITDALKLDMSKIKIKVNTLNIMNKAMPKYIQGKDLISLGLKPSPKFSEILKLSYEKQLHCEFANKDDALTWLKKNITYL